MDIIAELKESIALFKRYIDIADLAFRHMYEGGSDPITARRDGKIHKAGSITCDAGEIQYNFHGSGVWVKFPDGREVDYDYHEAGDSRGVIYFDRYKLSQFVKSDDQPAILKDESTFQGLIDSMYRNGLLEAGPNWQVDMTDKYRDWLIEHNPVDHWDTPIEFRKPGQFRFPK